MPTEQDPEEFIEEDEQDEIARRSIFSAGWFRALLVLTVLAIVVVVSLPYLLNWLEPTPGPPARSQAKVSEQAPPPASTAPPASAPSEVKPSTPPAAPAPTAPAPTSPAPAAKSEAPPAAPAPATPAPAEPPKTAQAPTPATPADRPAGTAPAPAAPAPSAPAAKAEPATKPETAKAETPKATAKRSVPAEGGSSGGSYWVQVGAFVEEKNAEALSRQLKGQNFPVTISRISRGGGAPAAAASSAKPAASGAQNQLFITGSTADAVNAALKDKGTAQAVKGGLVVNPPYDLETAMALSSALKKEGFKVVIRRAKAAPAPASASNGGGGGTIYHVVRVGGYPDRAKALQVRSELEAKGHSGFLAQGAAR
jgi:ribosomal protein L12E/L44/L45/RPP1/RPP2